MKTKRYLLSLLAACLFVLPMAAQAQVPVRVSYIPILDVTPLFVGIEKGFFKEQGLEITPIPSSGGATGVPGLMGGAYDVIFGNVVSTYLAQGQGFDLKIISAGTKLSDTTEITTGLVARKEDNIKSGKDLEGKTVGVNTRNGVIWLFARAWIAKTGGDPSKVSFREVGFPQMTDALRSGQIDAAFNVDPFFSAALASDEFEMIGQPYPEVQPGVEVGQWITTADFYHNNPDTIRKYTTAFQKAIRWYNANRDTQEVRDIIAGFTKMKPETLARMEFQELPETIDPAAQQTTADLMLESGLLKEPLDVTTVITPEAMQ